MLISLEYRNIISWRKHRKRKALAMASMEWRRAELEGRAISRNVNGAKKMSMAAQANLNIEMAASRKLKVIKSASQPGG